MGTEKGEVMQSRIGLRFASTLLLSLTLTQSTPLHSLDVLSIAVGALVSSGIASLTNWLTSPSKDKTEYERRHNHFKTLSKEGFVSEISGMNTAAGQSDHDILRQHELYRYPNFIAAIKTACPSYASYIKSLKEEITYNYKARAVRGFKTERRGSFLTRNLRDVRSYDYYEFYELIKRLSDEVLIEEELAQTAAQIKLQENMAAIEKLISQLPAKEQLAFIEKQLKEIHA